MMTMNKINAAIRDFRKATTPAAIKQATADGRQTADDVRICAALTLREELAKHAW